MFEKKSLSMKLIVTLLVVVLLIGCVAGGTIAYLMTKSETVENTFVAGEIGKLNLAETAVEKYIVIPGADITKDPVLTFEDFNVASYIFLKVDAAKWTVTQSGDDYIYTIGEDTATLQKEMSWTLTGWTKLEEGVYYKKVAADAGNQSWNIIKNNTISVEADITKDDIAAYENTLTFTAYAIQQAAFATPAAAWSVAQTATNS